VKQWIGAALVAAALAVTGCGGGSDGPKTVTKDLYIAEADDVCAGLADRIRSAGSNSPQTPKDITDSANVLADLYGDLERRLQDVKLPTAVGDRRGATAYIQAVGRTGSLLGQLRSSARSLEDAAKAKDANKVADAGNAVRGALDAFRASQAQANQRALSYGFNLCGNLN
jgi:hypothetical protein